MSRTPVQVPRNPIAPAAEAGREGNRSEGTGFGASAAEPILPETFEALPNVEDVKLPKVGPAGTLAAGEVHKLDSDLSDLSNARGELLKRNLFGRSADGSASIVEVEQARQRTEDKLSTHVNRAALLDDALTLRRANLDIDPELSGRFSELVMPKVDREKFKNTSELVGQAVADLAQAYAAMARIVNHSTSSLSVEMKVVSDERLAEPTAVAPIQGMPTGETPRKA